MLITHYHYVICPLCGSDTPKIRFRATKKIVQQSAENFCCTNSYLGQHVDIVECLQCGMVYNHLQPEPAELLTVYSSVEDPRYIQEERGRELTFRLSLQQLHRFCHPPGNLLDIGCYTGTFLKMACEQHWTTCGSELSVWAAQVARTAGCSNIYDGGIEHLPFPENTFDAITLWDVAEHLSNPRELFTHVSRLLKPDGIVALSTHLIDNMPIRILGTHYPFFMEMHLIHFSRNTLQALFAKCGLEIIAILPHNRVITATYFLEKLKSLIPFSNVLINPILQRPPTWLQRKYVKIGCSGLSNIFARHVRL